MSSGDRNTIEGRTKEGASAVHPERSTVAERDEEKSRAAERAPNEFWAKSHAYLRLAMALLLVALGVAVFYQTSQQGMLLGSVSAYYHTPVEAIFVGALIGIGVGMIALRGKGTVEEVVLNLGGMFAVVVAIVPTARHVDYDTAAAACAEAASAPSPGEAPTLPPCPTDTGTLADATRANVDNNMFALLIVGALILLVALGFAVKDWVKYKKVERTSAFKWGFGSALVVLVVAFAAIRLAFDSLVAAGHYVAAGGLFACIFVVALINARRKKRERDERPGRPNRADPGIFNRLMATLRGRWYALFAGLMVGVAVVGLVAVLIEQTTVFWLEIAVAVCFILFWVGQTWEEMLRSRPR